MEQEELTCIVCFEIFNKPVSIPCGHSFCKDCIQETLSRTNKCPLCFCPFFGNLEFKINIILQKICDKLRNLNEEKNENDNKIIQDKKDLKEELNENITVIEKEENKELIKEEKKKEENVIVYKELLGFQLSKLSPFFTGTLYKIDIENTVNQNVFMEIIKSGIFVGYYTKEDKKAVVFKLINIESFSGKFITLIVDCVEKIKIKSFEEISFKNNQYFLEHNLISPNEEAILIKIKYNQIEKLSNNLAEQNFEKLEQIYNRIFYFYNELKKHNKNEYQILSQRHKVFIVGSSINLNFQNNLEDFIEFCCSVLNFSLEKKLVLFEKDDFTLRLNIILEFLINLTPDTNPVFIFYIRERLENQNRIFIYLFIILFAFCIYKYFENKYKHNYIF